MNQPSFAPDEKLDYLCQTLHAVTELSLFFFDSDMNLLVSYSKWENHMKNFFLLNCPFTSEQILQSHSHIPLYYSDSLRLNWYLLPLAKQNVFLVLGPAFETNLTPAYFQKEMKFKSMSVSSQIQFLKMLHDIPVIPGVQFLQYLSMVYYGIYHTLPNQNQIILHTDAARKDTSADIKNHSFSIPESHGSRLPEKLMLDGVRTGNLNFLDSPVKVSQTVVGNLSNGDPLRQEKNAIISQITLVTRAAVEGGMDAEAAYSLSDFYIQQVELCSSPDETHVISLEMYRTFVEQVHEVRTANYSPLVLFMCTYIDKHIRETISLEELASDLDYDPYYLSSLFRKDTGKTIKTYILEKKVEQAKILLSSTLQEVQEISDSLSFKSSSYFCTQFKKITGESPLSYRKKRNKKT